MHGRKTLAALAALATGLVCASPAHAAAGSGCAALTDPAFSEVTLDGVACTGTYLIDRDLVITGVNGGGFSRSGVEEQQSTRSLQIDQDATVTLKDLRFVGAQQQPMGAAGAGGPGGVSFDEHSPEGRQGRVDAAPGGGSLTVAGSTFEGIFDGEFTGGYGLLGGALYADLSEFDSNETASLTITGSTFSRNRVTDFGGGVAIELPASAGLRRADGATAPVKITDSHFVDNVAQPAEGSAAGGGLYVNGYPRLTSSRAGAGRADAEGTDVELTNNDFTGNEAHGNSSSGGGAELRGVHVTSTRDRFLSSSAGLDESNGEGGGISVRSTSYAGEGSGFPIPGSFTAVNDAFAGNAVGENGNGAAIYGGSSSACGDDRARDVDPSACGTTIDLTHVTISGNHGGPGAAGAGVSLDDGDALNVDRSIIWGNTNDPQREFFPTRAAASNQPEIDDNGADYSVTRSDYCVLRIEFRADEAGNICEDPKLADAAYDPERVNLPDVHLTATSPAIDAVGVLTAGRGTATGVTNDYDRPAADARPQGNAPDMGADEVPVKTTTTTTTTTETPRTPATQAPPQQGVLPQVTSAAPCSSKRFFRIVLRKKKGRTYRSAKIWVNGQKAKVTTARDGRPTTRIDLRRFGYQTIRIRITAKVKGGKTLRGKRTYHPCRPSLDDGKPPKL